MRSKRGPVVPASASFKHRARYVHNFGSENWRQRYEGARSARHAQTSHVLDCSRYNSQRRFSSAGVKDRGGLTLASYDPLILLWNAAQWSIGQARQSDDCLCCSAVFLSWQPYRERCLPTAFGNDLTAEACESHRQYMEGHAKPGVKVVCRERFMTGRME
jgi:hypothetical protein